jgi:hypothetical protein
MKRHWQDFAILVLGLWVFLSTWALPHEMAGDPETTGAVITVAMWNLYVVGIAIALLATATLFAFRVWKEWTNLVLGAWLHISPWVLGFSTSALLAWNAVAAGALLVLLAASTIVPARGPTHFA